jgi:uncharacterized RDD family membrane protein YckC
MDKVNSNAASDKNSSELVAILELQQLIAEELDLSAEAYDPRAFTRAFIPLTDGLGLESPKVKEVPAPPSVREIIKASKKPVPEPEVTTEHFSFASESDPEVETVPEPVVPSPASLASVIESRPPEAQRTTPPPVPRPSFWRRLFATFVDEIFVLLLCAAAGLITLNIISGSTSYLSLQGLSNLRQPSVGKYLLLEFFTVWLCYFAVCLGLLDMTFGMWVWGVRVGYVEGVEGTGRFFAKTVRILLSFFFFAPIVPLFFLIFNRKGKNLIDGLSGTHLYRSLS